MVLPLSLLHAAQNRPMLVELKNGETYNGHLVKCDTWMNIQLRDVICTSRDGDRFWRMPEAYIRGSTIKYMRIPDEVLEAVKDDADTRRTFNRGRGAASNRGKRPQSQGRGGGVGPKQNRGGGNVSSRGQFQKKK